MSLLNSVFDNEIPTRKLSLSLEEIQHAVKSDINHRSQDGMTYLHRLCYAGNLEGIAYLLNSDCDIDVNCRDVFERTPLALAVSRGHTKVVKYLLSKKNKEVLIDFPNSCGETPLMNAARKGNSAIVDLLLKMNADCNSRNDQLDTSLHLICRCFEHIDIEQNREFISNTNECTRLLILSGARLDLRNSKGEPVMHAIAKTQCRSFLQVILSSGTNSQLLEGFRTSNDLGFLVWQLSTLNKGIRRYLFSKYKNLVFNIIHELGVEKLNRQDIIDWLRTVSGMNSYCDKFIECNLNGEDLLKLNHKTLENRFNMTNYQHRQSFLDSLKDLKSKSKNGDRRVLFNCNINSSMIVVSSDILGTGFFGKVYKATWKQAVVAVKKIFRKKQDSTEYIKSVFREIEVISSLRHPNILDFYGYTCHINGDISLVMEYMMNGSLKSMLEKNHALIFERKYQIVRDISLGMAHLHSCEYVHRDLNTKNLLLGEDYRVKVADFGLSRLKNMNSLMSTKIGFLGTMAPEVFNGEVYSEKADVFSFGMILYEILTGKETYSEFFKTIDNKSMNNYAYSVANDNYRPRWPADSLNIEDEWKVLTESCWNSNPEKRPSFLQILENLNLLEKCDDRSKVLADTDISGSKNYIVNE